MSMTPPSSDNFSEYYQQYLSQIGPRRGTPTPVEFPERTGQPQNLSFLERTIDILSRPLRIVSNPVMKGVELPEKIQELQEREAAGENLTAGEKFAPFGELITAPFTGFFSDDPENKPYWSDIIEKSEDVSNMNNPNYVDTENNVNPVVKGALGFVGDVALDPLTWVPGAALAKGWGTVGKLFGKAGKALPGASSKAAKEAAESGAAQVVRETPTPPIGLDDVTKTPNPAQATEFIRQSAGSAKTPKEALVSPLRKIINDDKIFPKGVSGGWSRRNQMDRFLKKLQEPLTPVPKIPVFREILDTGRWYDELDKLADAGKLNDISVPFDEVAGVKLEEQTLQGLTEVAARVEKSNPQAYQQWVAENGTAVREITDSLYQRYRQAAETNPNVNMFGELSDDAPALRGAAAAVARLAEMEEIEVENARFIFDTAGNRLFDSLRRMDAEEFTKFYDDAQEVLSRNGIVESMGGVIKGSAQAKLLRSFDISIPQFRTAQSDMVSRLAAVVNDTPPAPVDEAAENLANDDGFVEMLRAMLRRDNIRPDRMNFDNTDALKEIVGALSKAGAITMRTNFDPKYLAKNYKFILENGELKVLKTNLKKGEGVGRVQDTYGSFTQMTFYQNLGKAMSLLFRGVPERNAAGAIVRSADDKIVYTEPPKFLRGRKRRAWEGFDLSANLESATLQSMRAWNDWVSARGIPITIDAFYGGERVTETLRFEDIYEVLTENIDDVRRLRLVMFNGDTGMDVTLLGDATIAAMRGAEQAEVFEILRRGTNRWNNKPNNNWLAKNRSVDPEDTTYYFGHRPGEARPRNGDGYRWVPNKNEKGKTIGHYAQWDPIRNAEILADAIVRSRGTLSEVAQIRKQQYLARDITDFQTVSPMVAQNLVDMLRDPTRNAEAMLAIRNVGKMLKDFIAPIDVGEVGALYSAQALRAAIPQSVRNAVKAAEDMSKARKTGNRNNVYEASEKAARKDRETAEEIRKDFEAAQEEISANPASVDDATRELAEENAEYINDVPEWNTAQQVSGVDPILGVATTRERVLSALSSKWRAGTKENVSVFNLFLTPNRQQQNWAKRIENRLRRIKQNRAFGGLVEGSTPTLVQAMRNIQKGVPAADEANEIVRAAQTLLERETVLLFGTSNKLIRTIADTGFNRSGTTLEEIAKSLEAHAVLGVTDSTRVARLPERGEWFDLDLAERVAKEEGIDVVSAGLRQWSDWGDIEDPIGFIGKVNASVFSVATKAAFIDNFAFDMGKVGLATRSAKEAKEKGFVRLTADGKTAFGAYLPDNMFVDPDIAYVFTRMDEAMRTSRQLDSPFGKWWTDTMDPFMLTWKYTVTVIRLGHHIRNEIGGQSMRWIALGTNGFARSERNAYRILARDNVYRGVDILRGLTRMGERAPAGGETIISGRLGQLTEKEIWTDFTNNLRAVGKRAEDIYDEGLEGTAKRIADVGGAIATLGAGTRGGRIERTALGVSEFVENKARLAHYLQVLDQIGQKTAAGKPRQFVRGIGNVVTPKTMEEARQIAIESALKYHPDPSLLTVFEARYLRRVFPFYNWYKQALVALLESAMTNPARTLTTIPKASYNAAIAAGIDPYSLYDPFPEDQMFPSFLTDDMTGPQFKIGERYVAVNPGFANMDVFSDTFSDPVAGVVQMTNPIIRTPIELLAGSRLGTQAPIRDVSDFIDSSIPGINYVSNITGRSVTGGFEEQSRIASGDKQAFDQWLSAFNWAFGLGVRNYSRPSYINYAEIEARNEAADR